MNCNYEDLEPIILAALKKANTANSRIDNLPLPMVFKGTLGTGGTISTLPTASSENEGFVYIVITDGTYAGQTAKAGDTFVSDGSAWVLVPSADEPSVIDDSVTSTALTWSSDKLSGLFDGVKVKSFTYTGDGTMTDHRIDLPNDCHAILTIARSATETGARYDRSDGILIPLTSGYSELPATIANIDSTSVVRPLIHISHGNGYIVCSSANSARYNLNESSVVYTVYYI